MIQGHNDTCIPTPSSHIRTLNPSATQTCYRHIWELWLDETLAKALHQAQNFHGFNVRMWFEGVDSQGSMDSSYSCAVRSNSGPLQIGIRGKRLEYKASNKACVSEECHKFISAHICRQATIPPSRPLRLSFYEHGPNQGKVIGSAKITLSGES